MGSSGQRFGAAYLVLGLALCAASACSGAATTRLDQTASPSNGGSSSGDQMSNDVRDATTGSSSGGGRHQDDATAPDEASLDDAVVSMGTDDASDDAGNPVSQDAGPPDASALCGTCTFGNKCCTVPGAISYGQCYSVLCGGCCF